MHRTALVFLAVMCLMGARGWGETLRLPMRYEETTYTVHTMTGLTSDEKTREKLLPAPVEVKKVVVEEQSFVAFVSKPRRGGEDKTDTQEVLLPFAERRAFLDALGSAEPVGRKVTSAREAVERTLFSSSDGDIELTLVTVNNGRAWVVNMGLGDRTYVLDSNYVGKVAAAVRKL